MIEQITGNIKIFTYIAGLGLILSLIFLIGLTFQALRKRSLKVWVWGLIISAVVTAVAYIVSLSNIFQLYQITSS
ncbi:MAG: hypothetical protein A2Z11_04515 [Candidatus Woykebacteria bacterium RBG_16_43_9]|uniref:DUF2759 domain-containing protein n=1 Tax=Candidatus Woykebacteria bacterium RBG_16_43_9 TaxID=1802596 RepID=A0A1G1WDB3_9BACT|nr:MAG: hypothetical protein A2Z11_04515 [Candidatus Woykebacteria bacterium RBG_16_43_9]